MKKFESIHLQNGISFGSVMAYPVVRFCVCVFVFPSFKMPIIKMWFRFSYASIVHQSHDVLVQIFPLNSLKFRMNHRKFFKSCCYCRCIHMFYEFSLSKSEEKTRTHTINTPHLPSLWCVSVYAYVCVCQIFRKTNKLLKQFIRFGQIEIVL